MAIEATHFNLFTLQERDLVNSSNNEQRMCFPANPIKNHQPFYQQAVCDSIFPKKSINTESGVTCNMRKRCRDSVGGDFPAAGKFNVVGENFLPQTQQFQLEIDALISQHAKRIKSEIQERQKQQTKLLIASIGEGALRKLNEKDEQIQKMIKLNMFLQDRVKSLYIQNQLWREMAQSNEATVNSLRTNLENALAGAGGAAAVDDDAESCCDNGDAIHNEGYKRSCYGDRRCRRCGVKEACVLLLPCRHLCLCNGCGSGPHQPKACPVCNCSMNATVHVNESIDRKFELASGNTFFI